MYHIFSNKSGVLYFRYVVPKSVLVHFPKLQKTYNRSLGTSYRREAKNKAVCLYADIHTRLEVAVKLVDELHRTINTLEECGNRVVDKEGLDKEFLISGIAEIRCQLDWLQKMGHIDKLTTLDLRKVSALYREYKPLHNQAETECQEIEKREKYKKILSTELNSKGINLPPPNETQTDDLKTDPPQILLSEVIDEYCDEQNKGGNWTSKTIDENKASFNLFLKFVGNKHIDTITRKDIRDYKTALQNLPSNRNKKRVYKGKSIHELIKLDIPDGNLLAVRTINKNLSKPTSLFKWSVQQGYCDHNVAEGMTIKQKRKASEERDIFTDDDLKNIFSTEIHTH